MDELAGMDGIALRLGWVAIHASRVEAMLAFLQVTLKVDEAVVVGSNWNANYESCKKLYRELATQQRAAGDAAEAGRLELFRDMLIELNSWMLDRHHVMHAIWEQSVEQAPGIMQPIFTGRVSALVLEF